MVFVIMFTSMEKILVVLKNLEQENQYFVNLLLIYKPIKLWYFWDAFWKYNPNQKNHGLAYMTSLMTHVQSFEVLSTKCIWSSDFILIGIQLA
jgi:hypothetical protein